MPVGVFDDPETFEPKAHHWDPQRLGGFDLYDGLPRYQKSGKTRLTVLGEARPERSWTGRVSFHLEKRRRARGEVLALPSERRGSFGECSPGNGPEDMR